MKQKRKKCGRKLLSFLLTLAMVVGLMPGMSLTALAWDGDPYAALLNTTTAVYFDGKEWYLIEDNSTAANARTVTLLTKECVAASKFNENGGNNTYSGSIVETAVNNYYTKSISSNVKSAIVDNKMFLLTKEQANAITNAEVRKCSNASNGGWWLGEQGVIDTYAACVSSVNGDVIGDGADVSLEGGVRPALQLNLESVIFSSETNTFSLKPVVTEYPLWVGGEQVTSENASNIDGDNKASFDPETNTLTLNNYSYSGEGNKSDISATAGIYSNGIDLSIELIGTNTITTNGSAQSQSGIDIVNGNLTITARDNGSLTVTGGNSNDMGSISNGICVRRTLDDSARDSKLTIADGATVNAAVNTTNEFASGTGVYANDGLDVSGTLIADGGNGGQSFGVQTNGDVDVSGTLIATAGSSVAESYGIYTYKNVTVREGGVVKASAIGNTSDEMCKGVGIYTWTAWDESAHSEVDGKVIIEGGEVTASGYDCGIQSRDSVIIKGGKVTATAEEGNGIRCGARNWETGIYENGTISFEGGSVTASGSDKGVYAQNVSISDGLTAMAGDEAPGADVTNTFATNHDQKWVKVEPPKIPQDITAPDVTVTYGDIDKSVSASVTYPTEGGGAISYAVKDGSKDYIDVDATTGALTIKKVGTATVIVTAAETSTYAQATKEVTVTISKSNAVAVKVTANNRTYDGTDKPLVNVDDSTLVGGEMYYAVTTENKAPTDEKLYTTEIPTKTEAGTYYVWYKAKGDDNHTDSVAGCITVTISRKSTSSGSSGSSSSSSGSGGSTPTTPSGDTNPSPTGTESYTIPVENENSVNVDAAISDGTAKISDISDNQIAQATETGTTGDTAGETTDNNTLTIDVSGAKQDVNTVELPKTTVDRLADTTADTTNNVDTVTVQMTNAKVEMDAQTLQAVSDQAVGKDVKLVVDDTSSSKLTSAQQSAINKYSSATTFEAYFESNGQRIGDFKGGTAKVSVKYTAPAGLLTKFLHMLYVAVTGETEYFPTSYYTDSNGIHWVQGDLKHFSDYAIVYDETKLNKDGEVEADPYSGLDQSAFDADASDFVDDDVTVLANGMTAYANGIDINKSLMVSQTGSNISVSWGKVKGATGYKVYAGYCGKTMPTKPVKTLKKAKFTIKKLNGKKLNLKKNYKVYVVAYKTVDGVDKVLGRTVTAHVVGAKNTKYSNPKKLTIKSKTKVTLKKGKTTNIKATVTLVNKKRKSLTKAHAAKFRYASSDKKIATVTKKGKIKARKKGTCYIWVYAKNGYAKKVKVTVK